MFELFQIRIQPLKIGEMAMQKHLYRNRSPNK